MGEIKDVASEKMNKTIAALKRELASIRAGRANPQVLDRIMVDYYGTPTPIPQVGNVSSPEPRMLTIALWDTGMLNEVEKAIQASDLGINPSNDGKIIRLIFPELTEERRKDLVKQVHKKGEESKVAIRSIRRDANDQIDKQEKAKELTEDDAKDLQKQIQKITDDSSKEIERLVGEKEKEIMEV